MLAHPDSPGKKAAKRFDGICINSSFNSEKIRVQFLCF